MSKLLNFHTEKLEIARKLNYASALMPDICKHNSIDYEELEQKCKEMHKTIYDFLNMQSIYWVLCQPNLSNFYFINENDRLANVIENLKYAKHFTPSHTRLIFYQTPENFEQIFDEREERLCKKADIVTGIKTKLTNIL